ncbi:hypothetical protein N7513_003696 [Penicillium frequentans]|nr:hypothetical protein N7513_003696 [Penicillium glabrum]
MINRDSRGPFAKNVFINQGTKDWTGFYDDPFGTSRETRTLDLAIASRCRKKNGVSRNYACQQHQGAPQGNLIPLTLLTAHILQCMTNE